MPGLLYYMLEVATVQTDWPIFVLTLEGDEERRQPLLDQLKKMGLQWRLIFGVDGRKGLPPEYEAMIDREAAQNRLNRPMTDPELACALSHRHIYNLVLEEGLSGAVVLEDDAILWPDFHDFLRGGYHLTETLLLLDYDFGRALPWQRRKVGRWRMYRPARMPTLATAYTLSRNTARELLQAATPVSFVADWPADLYHLCAWLVAPRVVDHSLPGQGLSHLFDQRSSVQRPRERKSFARFLQAEYYRGLLRRRLARRVVS